METIQLCIWNRPRIVTKCLECTLTAPSASVPLSNLLENKQYFLRTTGWVLKSLQNSASACVYVAASLFYNRHPCPDQRQKSPNYPCLESLVSCLAVHLKLHHTDIQITRPFSPSYLQYYALTENWTYRPSKTGARRTTE
jgi:hypothetical protein